MFTRLQDAVQILNQEYIQSFIITKDNRTYDLHIIVDFLERYCNSRKISFVYGH